MHWFWKFQYYGSIIAIICNIISVVIFAFMIRFYDTIDKKQKYYLEIIKSLVSVIILMIYIWVLRRYGVVI